MKNLDVRIVIRPVQGPGQVVRSEPWDTQLGSRWRELEAVFLSAGPQRAQATGGGALPWQRGTRGPPGAPRAQEPGRCLLCKQQNRSRGRYGLAPQRFRLKKKNIKNKTDGRVKAAHPLRPVPQLLMTLCARSTCCERLGAGRPLGAGKPSRASALAQDGGSVPARAALSVPG